MKLFGENVQSKHTNAEYNILQVENYEEIFFDVFKLNINGQTYMAEKVSEYGQYPIILCDVSLDPTTEEFYPFVLKRGGASHAYFNEANVTIPEFRQIVEESSDNIENIEDELELDSTEYILEAIETAKVEAKVEVQKYANAQLKRRQRIVAENNAIVQRVVDDAKNELLVEFLNATKTLKTSVSNQNLTTSKLALEHIEAELEKVERQLKSKLDQTSNKISETLETKLANRIQDIYEKAIVPSLNSKFDLVRDKLDDKVDSEQLKNEVSNIATRFSKPINRLKNRISEVFDGVKMANVDIDILANSLGNKIDKSETEIKEYFKPKLELLESKMFDLSEETRSAIKELIVESKDKLIEEIRDVNNIIPVEYVIENSSGSRTLKKDDLDKQIDKRISDKVSSHVTELRKYIAVYSGGGSVAQQFANGGTMIGNLVITGSISAAQYLGITGGGGSGSDVSGLSANWQNTFTTVQANSASWGGGTLVSLISGVEGILPVVYLPIASKAEAEAGISTTTVTTPERVAQAIAVLGSTFQNLDGGSPTSVYGGTPILDGGTP